MGEVQPPCHDCCQASPQSDQSFRPITSFISSGSTSRRRVKRWISLENKAARQFGGPPSFLTHHICEVISYIMLYIYTSISHSASIMVAFLPPTSTAWLKHPETSPKIKRTCSATVSSGAASIKLNRWGCSSRSGQKAISLETIKSWGGQMGLGRSLKIITCQNKDCWVG